MLKFIDGLCAVIEDQFKMDPSSSALLTVAIIDIFKASRNNYGTKK